MKFEVGDIVFHIHDPEQHLHEVYQEFEVEGRQWLRVIGIANQKRYQVPMSAHRWMKAACSPAVSAAAGGDDWV